jgi:hypothetical protein
MIYVLHPFKVPIIHIFFLVESFKIIFLFNPPCTFCKGKNIYHQHSAPLTYQWSSNFPLLMRLLTITTKYTKAILVQYNIIQGIPHIEFKIYLQIVYLKLIIIM